MSHNLRQLHFSELIQFLGFKHLCLYFAQCLGVNFHSRIVGEVLGLDAVGAQLLTGSLVPRMYFHIVFTT